MSRPLGIRVVDGGGEAGSLYAKQPKVYPREIDGRFQRLRTIAVFWLLGMFYVFPWISIGGQQLVLFDLPARRFHIFGLTFWPQDFYLLTMLLVIAALTLFFFTALAGRLWCGYACPQTVWTEVFLWMERWIEGDRNARMRLDKSPWNWNRVWRKAAKQAIWIAFALWTGFTFVGFFTPIRGLAQEILAGTLGGWALFWTLFYAFATWGNAGFLREQVCKYMCPYARFQSAMFDKDTLVISYDGARGEPRGHRRRVKPAADAGIGDSGLGIGQSGAVAAATVAAPTTSTPAPDLASASSESRIPNFESQLQSESRIPNLQSRPLGDCIDCLACVQVCPTGIDIRDGLQIECIACAACIDACDAVMDKMAYPRGLIRYTTEHAMAGRGQRILRPRVFLYGAILASFIGAFLWAVGARAPVLVEVLHDRNALFRTVGGGAIENSYNVKLVNKSGEPRHVAVRLAGDLPLRTLGTSAVTLEPGEVFSLPLTLRADAGALQGRQDIVVEAAQDDGSVVARAKAQFFAPEKQK